MAGLVRISPAMTEGGGSGLVSVGESPEALLPLQPVPQRRRHGLRLLQRRKMAAILDDDELRPRDRRRHLLMQGGGCQRVLPAAEEERRAGDGGEARAAVGPGA